MCGIAGILNFQGEPDVRPLEAMRDAMAHRGPDDARSVRLPDGAMGARRLAILDPARGAQPVSDPSGRFWVVMNGEIYNHRQLRAEWVAWGARFRTTCDTELVAHVVAKLGFRRALGRLEGMFALAVYDTRERCLWLVRDRMGEKPLHLHQLPDGTLLFASELKGLLAHPLTPREVDPQAVGQYLVFEYVPTPRTIYRGITRLPPASWLRADRAGVTTGRYWELPRPAGGGGSPGAFRRWSESLLAAFQVAVLSRRDADVPVGVVLSGGLDSSSVLAVAARGRTPTTVTVAMEPRSFDESDAARELAELCGARHHEIPLHHAHLPEILRDMGRLLDEPLGDSSLPATWHLFRAVKELGLKAVLSGDGGDECLGGYPTYLAHRLAGSLAPARGALRALAGRLPVSMDNVSMDYMAKRFVEGLGHPIHRRNQVWLGAFLPEELPPQLRSGLFEEVDVLAAELGHLPPECLAMALDQRLYLGDGVLVKVDRASSAHGVEVRTPFLDHRMVELAAEVPSGLKLRRLTTKAVWRRAVSDLLPPAALRRPKKGFGTPTGPWLRGPLTGLLEALPERVAAWMPEDVTARLIGEHRRGAADHRRRLWSLLVLATWLDGPWGPR